MQTELVGAQGLQAPVPALSSLSEPKVEDKPYPWILHPAIDLVLVCGGIFWVMAGLVLVGVRLDPQGALVFGIVSNVLFSHAHQPATLYRVYACPRTRKNLGLVVTLWGVIVLGLGAAGLFYSSVTEVLLNVTLIWAYQHLQAQSYGITLIYCYKRGYIMTNREKQSLSLLFNSVLAFLIIRWLTVSPVKVPVYTFYLPMWQPLPEWVSVIASLALQCSILYFVFMAVRKWIKERKVFPLPALLVIVTSVFVALFFTGSRGNAIIGVFFQNFFHSAQYIVVTTAYFLKEKGLPEGVPLSRIASQLYTPRCFRYFGFVLLLGLTLAVVLPTALTVVGFVKSAAVTYCVLNLHHYFTDSMIWKMRDPVVRKLLVA